jgi:hypothetical protein
MAYRDSRDRRRKLLLESLEERRVLATSTPDLVAAVDSGISDTDNITNVAQPFFAGNGATAAGTVQIRSGTTVLGSGTAFSNGAWSVMLTTNLSEGVNTLTAHDVSSNIDSSPLVVTLDTVNPTVLSSTPDSAGQITGSDASFHVVFDSPVFNVTADDFALTLSGSATGNITGLVANSSSDYTVLVSGCTGVGTARVDFNSSTDVTDVAGNAADPFSGGTEATINNTSLTPVITGPAGPTNANPLMVQISFGGTVTGFVASDIVVGNGQATGLVDNGSGNFTATIVPAADGLVTADVPANVASDTNGNPNNAATQYSVTVDTAAPIGYSITSDDTAINASESLGVGFTFAGAEVGDTYSYSVTSSGGGTAATGSGTIATATHQIGGIDVSGLGDGTLTFSVTLTDPAGNSGAPATATAALDRTAPSVTIAQADGQADPTSDSPVVFVVTFSEPITEFDNSDIILGGTAGPTAVAITNPSSDNRTFLVQVGGMTASGAATINVGAGAAADLAGNPNAAATIIDNSVTINSAPVWFDASTIFMPTIDANDTGIWGVSVEGISVPRIDDADGDAVGLAIVGKTGAANLGTWQYRTTPIGNWLTIPAVSDGSALHLFADGATRIRFQPAGTATGNATLLVRAWDRTDGVANGALGAITATGGATAYSAGSTVMIRETVLSAANDPPSVAHPLLDGNAAVGANYSFTVPANTFADQDAGTVLTYFASLVGGAALPNWLSFNQATLTLSGTPSQQDFGTIRVLITAKDQGNMTASSDYFLTVSQNQSPVLTIGDNAPTIAENSVGPLTTVSGMDPEGAALTFSLTGPDAAYFQIADGSLSFVNPPDYESAHGPTYQVTVALSDGFNAPVTSDIVVSVTNVTGLFIDSYAHSVNYIENAVPLPILAGTTTLTDEDSGNFIGGKLTVAKTGNNSFYDVLAIANQGTEDEQIGVTGNTVKYEGATIGTFTGGTGGVPLVVTFTTSAATPEAVETLLRAITFSNPLDKPYVPARTVQFTLTDGDGVTANLVDQVVTVTSVPDGPVIANFGGTGLSYTENDGPLALLSPGTSVTDVDSTNFKTGKLTVGGTNISLYDVLAITNQGSGAGQIGISGNSVTFGGATIGTFSGGTSYAPLIVHFTTTAATPQAVQALLTAITFRNTSDLPFLPMRTINFTLIDDTGTPSNTASQTVAMTSVNDAPTLAGPTSQSTTTNTPLVFSNSNGNLLTLADIDAGAAQLKLSITATGGTVTLIGTTGLTFISGANGQTSFTVKGTLANLNAALDGLSFGPAVNFTGDASLQLTANDLGNTGAGGAQTATKTVTIAVANPETVIDNGGTGFAETVGTWFNSSLKGYNNSSTRYSPSANASATWTTPLSPGYYQVELYKVVHANSTTNATASVIHNGTTFSQTIDLSTGTSGFVNLGSFQFSGDGSEMVKLVRGNSGNLRADAVRFTKLPSNVVPTLAAPATQSTTENVNVTFSSASGNAIVAGDVDSLAAEEQLAIAATHGTATLSTTNGLTIVAGANGSASLTVKGTIANLNAALNGLVFTPANSFDGAASLQLTLNDLGNTGADGPQSVSKTIAITVNYPNFVVDNGTAGYSETGTWATSSLHGYNNSSTRFSASTSATATWTPTLTPGAYQISFYRVSNASNQTSAKLTIKHNGITEAPVTINLTGPSGFVTLPGTYTFSGAGNEFLKLSQTTAGTLRADAVRFTKVAG